MNSRDLFKKTHSAYESRQVFDGAYAVSARESGQVAGACASLKAICSPDATDQDLWHVVHLDAGSRLLLDSVAVLGASGQDQAAEWAMQDFGQHMGAVGVIGVASGSAIALRRVLDDGLQRGRVTQALLDSAGSRVTAHPVRWLDGVGIASHGGSMATLFLDMVRHDEDGLLLDAMTAADLMEGAEQGQFDALIVDYAHLEMLQNRLAAALSKVAANGLSVSGVTATKPFKRNGVAQVAVMFDFSDGQTFTAFFHNPDSTPAKLAPKDILTSWKFTLNKRDVTAVVQPEQGENVQMPKLASRIMQLVAKNSDRFKRANARKGEMAAQVQEVQARIDQKQTQLAELESDIADLQVRIDERLKAKPVAGGSLTTTQAKNQALDRKIKLVADSVEKVRKQDVQRLLESVDGNTKASRNAARKKMGDYLKAFRPDLAEEVDSVMFDLQEDTFVEADDLARFGQVEITSQGSENIYFTKDGQKYYSKVYNTERFPKGPFDLAANPNGLKNGKAEEWHTDVPTEGLPELKEEKKKFYDFRLVINRLADDAVKAITRTQKLGNVSLYAYYMPSIPNTGRHGIVRLFPDDQTPGGNWKLLDPQVFHAGMVSDDQIKARLIDPLSKAPVLAHSQQSDTGNGTVSGGSSENPDGLTDAEMVVLISTRGYKPKFRYDAARKETSTNRRGDDGISKDQYNAAVDSLNAKGKYLKRSAITDDGQNLVNSFMPELNFVDKKLAYFAGKFAASEQPEMTDAKKIELVDKAYRFASATDEFKIFAADAQIQNQNADDLTSLSAEAEYDPLSTAVAMDKAAKKNGFAVKWQMFTEPGVGDDLVARIYKGRKQIGRISMGGDGKAMVYVGASGDARVTTPDGRRAFFSDDDAPDMIDWLANSLSKQASSTVEASQPQQDDQEAQAVNPPTQEPAMNPDLDYLQSIVNGDADLSDGEAVEAELERIGENLAPELEALFEQAVDAYAAYQVQQASKVA